MNLQTFLDHSLWRTSVGMSTLILMFQGIAWGWGENPLLLPTPIDPQKPGFVMLHGGGDEGDEIVSKFIELAGGRNARIVLIPSGSFSRGQDADGTEFPETEDEFEARMRRVWKGWVERERNGEIESLKIVHTDNQTDCDQDFFVNEIRQATGVWLPAAYQGKLAWRFTHRYPDNWEESSESLFQEELRNVVARGGIVCGIGGGMSALPEVMILRDQDDESDPNKAEVQPGLGLFQGAIVDENFDAIGGRLERLTDLLKDTRRLNGLVRLPATGRNMIGLAVDQNTALILSENSLKVIGAKNGHVFLKSNGDRTIVWRLLSKHDGITQIVAASNPRIAATFPERMPVAQPINPFGMPLAFDTRKPGTVVLHGGGESDDVVESFPELCPIAKPNIVQCPAAYPGFQPEADEPLNSTMEQIREYFRVWTEMEAEERLGTLDFITTSNPADANRLPFVQPLQRAHGVWFSGGDQSELARLFVDPKNPTRFEKELHGVLARGGVVGGSSAGTAIMARVMTVAGFPVNGRPAYASIDRGLSILDNVIIEQHFGGPGRRGRIERFTGLLLDNERLRTFFGQDGGRPEDMIGLAIEEEAAFVLQENRLRVIGTNKAHVFLKSTNQKTITWHELRSGDAAFILATPSGHALYIDEWQLH